jgi:hypothetical protein
VDLPDQDVALLLALQHTLRNSNLPFRRPSNEQPTFWSRPITLTKIEPVAAGSWVNFLTLSGLTGGTNRISSYVATTFGDQTLSGVQFRFLFNGTLAPNMALANDVDHNKITSTSFPVVPQSTCFLVEEKDTLVLQVRNTGVFAQMVCGALLGWRYDNTNSVDKTARSVITDDT